MQNFTDFFRNNDKNLDFLGKISEPLKRAFGIDVFWSSTVHEDGKFDCLCSYDDAFGYFWENECYNDMAFYVAPSHLKSGYFLLDHDVDYSKYMYNTHEKYRSLKSVHFYTWLSSCFNQAGCGDVLSITT